MKPFPTGLEFPHALVSGKRRFRLNHKSGWIEYHKYVIENPVYVDFEPALKQYDFRYRDFTGYSYGLEPLIELSYWLFYESGFDPRFNKSFIEQLLAVWGRRLSKEGFRKLWLEVPSMRESLENWGELYAPYRDFIRTLRVFS